MISAGKSYMIFKPKEKTNSKGEREVSFSIGNSVYNKETKTYTNNGFVYVTAKTNQYLSDKDKVTVSKIISVNPTIYYDRETNKPVASGFFTIELEGEQQGNYEAVPNDELPF